MRASLEPTLTRGAIDILLQSSGPLQPRDSPFTSRRAQIARRNPERVPYTRAVVGVATKEGELQASQVETLPTDSGEELWPAKSEPGLGSDLEASLRLEPGQRFDRYEVLELLGRGGMGAVVAAHDEQLDRKVALKFLIRARQGKVARERLVSEARSLARLSHPNIVAVYEVGEAAGVPYLAMEHIQGQTLRDWLDVAMGEPTRSSSSREPSKPLTGTLSAPSTPSTPPGPSRLDILTMFLAVGRGLEAAHELGVVHRDFKPNNVLVGDDGRPRVVDFGLARLSQVEAEVEAEAEAPARDASSPPARAGAPIGTPAYMAPEQWAGQEPDARGDQFAYCVALFRGLYAHPPFAGQTMPELMSAVLHDAPREIARAERVPPLLHAAILRGLSKQADERWPSMEPLLELIEFSLTTVQPGLFAGRPRQLFALILPLFWTLPITWFVLERLSVVTYAPLSWAAVSGTQVLAMALGVLALRELIVEYIGDARMLGVPLLLAFFMLGHRAIAIASESSLELMFAYDFLAIAGVGAVVSHLVDRRLWTLVVFNLTMAVVAVLRPEWAPHMWVVFSACAPLIAVASLSRTTDRLRGEATLSATRSLPPSSRRSRSRSPSRSPSR